MSAPSSSPSSRQLQKGQKKENKLANDQRREGRATLKNAGVHILMTDEQWANESHENKMSWNNMNLHKVLKRGPNFRFTTQRLSQNDKYMAINRAIISMSVSIRKTLKARVIGEQLTKSREWELSKGLKIKAHKFHVNPQPKKLNDLLVTLDN